MKKFLFALLFIPLLWGGVSFAGPSIDYCTDDAGCDTTKPPSEILAKCIANQDNAQTEYDEEQERIKGAVKSFEKEIEDLEKAYNDCIAGIDPILKLSPNLYQIEVDDCDDEVFPSYSKQIANKKEDIATEEQKIEDFEKSLNCANKIANDTRVAYVGETTGSFDIGLLRASDTSQEHLIDIVDDVEGETNILNKVLKLLTQVLGTFAVLMLIIGAYYMITSQGDESQLQKGKNIFFYTVVGILIAFSSFILVQFVISVIFTSTGSK